MAQPGRDIGRDIAKGESVEAEINRFISKRHEQRVRDEGERAVEVVWAESSRREEARQQAEHERGRLALCRHLEAVYARRSAEYGRQGDELEGREAKKRQVDSVETLIPEPDPDRLMPAATATT